VAKAVDEVGGLAFNPDLLAVEDEREGRGQLIGIFIRQDRIAVAAGL
jgi:hypothetical protein